MLAFERFAEEKIRKAIAAGEFDNLSTTGKPLNLDEYASVHPEQRLAYIVLKNSGFMPRNTRPTRVMQPTNPSSVGNKNQNSNLRLILRIIILPMRTPSPTLLAHIETASHIAVLTGAGVSAESGLATFRGPGGLWKNYRPEDLATPEAFHKDPKLVWDWYNFRREKVREHAPNPGHHALAQLESRSKKFSLITQNVDGYHRGAGSKNVIELHGNIMLSRCSKCNHECVAGKENWKNGLPYCSCGALYRPGVVWFGEPLPESALQEAFAAAASCDIFFSIGTSAVVYPAAALPQIAHEHGAYLVEINPERTPLTPLADEFLQGAAGEILPMLVKGSEA